MKQEDLGSIPAQAKRFFSSGIGGRRNKMDPDTILCIRVAAPSNSELVKERGIGVKNIF